MMSSIPKDPIILLSFINTKLRDAYPSLAELCESLEVSGEELSQRLSAAGYHYDEKHNQFVCDL